MLSLSKTYYQIFLSQAVALGLGIALQCVALTWSLFIELAALTGFGLVYTRLDKTMCDVQILSIGASSSFHSSNAKQTI